MKTIISVIMILSLSGLAFAKGGRPDKQQTHNTYTVTVNHHAPTPDMQGRGRGGSH
jgi:hypothetical protein